MTQRDVVKIAGGIVVGIVLAALLGAGLFGVNLGGNTETTVTLWVPGSEGPCKLGKAEYVRAKKGKRVIWEIENYCPGGPRTVTLGNFRTTSGPSGADTCDDAGADYPFTSANLQQRTAAVAPDSDGEISLTVKGRGDLGENELTYYFDICLDGVKADPMLEIAR